MAILTSSVPGLLPTAATSPASWRRFRDLIAPVLKLQVQRAVRKGEPVVIGSRRSPYESLTERHALLDLLPWDRSLVVRLRCRDERVLDDLPRLVELDRRHDLSVEWLVDRPSMSRSVLEAAGRLTAEGIRVRLVWRAATRGAATRGVDDLETWVAEARRLQIWDIRCESEGEDLERRFELLRLEYGFPVFSPGRG